jgi:short-subunit dehydrogenase
MSMKERYGPWALLVGGSEGVGEHLARKLGAAGINIVLAARNPGPLAETSQAVRDACGVDVRTVQVNIAKDNMLDAIRAVTDDLEIGLLVHNVGGAPYPGLFVEGSLKAALNSARVNPIAFTTLAHHFGKPMADRGRGGILMIGSMAGNVGNYMLSTYSAGKAYNQILCEALWAELKPKGVDVLAFPIGTTDTPARRRSGVVDSPIPLLTSERVAQEALDHLGDGPVHVSPEYHAYFASLCTNDRKAAIKVMSDFGGTAYPEELADRRTR